MLTPQLKAGSPPVMLPATLSGLYMLQAAALILLLIVYKAGGASNHMSPSLRYGVTLAAALLFGGAILIFRDWFSHSDRRRFALTLIVNLASVLMFVILAETGLRVTISLYPRVAAALPRGLLPRDWHELAATNERLLQRDGVSDAATFLIFDEVLGWKPGAGRKNADGMYISGVEGIRSESVTYSYRGTSGARRIALVGDSYTFGLGVNFEATWGNRLQEFLGDENQVLNFGVAGYGVDQAYLRYREEALSWAPEIVILGLISHDFTRTSVVYPFIAYPKWQIPFAKPRYVLDEGRLELKNVPLPAPDMIFGLDGIAELPIIELEPTYIAQDWDRRWYHGSYAVRFLLSISPRWPATDPREAASVKAVNVAIIDAFLELAHRNRSRPVVVFLPSYGAGEVGTSPGRSVDARESVVEQALTEAGIEHVSMTSCLEHLPRSEGIAQDGQHYSPEANRLVAACLRDYLRLQGLL